MFLVPASHCQAHSARRSSETYLLAVELEVESAAAQVRDDSDVRSPLSDVFLLAFTFGWVGELIEHKLFLQVRVT